MCLIQIKYFVYIHAFLLYVTYVQVSTDLLTNLKGFY